jgi:hypothetical protein
MDEKVQIAKIFHELAEVLIRNVEAYQNRVVFPDYLDILLYDFVDYTSTSRRYWTASYGTRNKREPNENRN